MSPFNRKLLRLGAVIGLYSLLAAGSLYVLQIGAQDNSISSSEIPGNELKAKNYLELVYRAQRQYYAVDWDQDGIKCYAEFLAHLWQTVDHEANPVRNSLIPQKLAFAMGVSRAIDGYYFQNIHTKEIQSGSPDPDEKDKHGNRRSIDIDPTREWAIVAIPASYGRSGRLSFIVGSSGKIYAKDHRDRPVDSIPENFMAAGWQEISNIR